MNCPYCGHPKTQVYRTVHQFRYRKCRDCQNTFKTQELTQEMADLCVSIAKTVMDLPNYSALKRRTQRDTAKLLKKDLSITQLAELRKLEKTA